MHISTERAVERAIDTMRIDMSQQLTVDDMARAAMFSKFHFTRVFQRVTGVSPALRSYEVSSMSGGEDAQGEVTVEVEVEGRRVRAGTVRVAAPAARGRSQTTGSGSVPSHPRQH